MVTEVPAIEVPTKFEDLLEDPRIVFKSVSGNWENVAYLNYYIFELRFLCAFPPICLQKNLSNGCTYQKILV